MGEYRLTRDADFDLLDVFVYGFQTFGLSQAERYRDDLARCFVLLAENPKLGRKADAFEQNARRHAHGRHVIFYEEQNDGVLILAVIHERSIRRLLGS